MNRSLVKSLGLFLALSLLSIEVCFGRNAGRFCDNSFVDAVLWDGISYKVTRNEWIAQYDPKSGTVDQLVHLSEDSFQNEKGYYYQSVYHIPTVPECNETTVSCEMMAELKGVTVYVIRRYRSADKESVDVIHRIYRKGNMRPPVPELQEKVNIDSFIESNLLPKRSSHKYRPSVYSPKDMTFIHITNQYQNFGPLLETIQLQTNGVTERSYHELNEYKDIVFITSFWWTFDQKLYIIGEHKTGFGNPFIYELQIRNNRVVLKPIDKSVPEFFGCNKLRANYLEKSIRTKISDYDLGHWSVEPVKTTTAQAIALNKTRNGMSKQREGQTTYSSTTPMSPTPRPTNPLPEQSRSVAPPYQVNDYRNRDPSQRGQRQYDRTEYRERVSTHVPTIEPRREHPSTPTAGRSEPEPTPPLEEYPDSEPEKNRTLAKMDMAHLKRYVSLKVTDFWKIFPTIVLFCFLVFSILVIFFGSVAVINLRNILKTNVSQRKIINLKNQRLKYDDGFHDFFIEEFNTSPKRVPSVDNNSCQTNESFESTENGCDPGKPTAN